jgi:integrase
MDGVRDAEPRVAAWFRLRLVTGQRGGELMKLRWQDIDESGEWWTIPGEFAKNAQGHRVYLNDQARKIIGGIKRQEGPWVFPEELMGDYKHVARRLAQPARANILRPGAEPPVPEHRASADFTGHDLRRTAASYMASGGVPRFIISRILNHSQDKDITGVYDRYSYDAEKKAAMKFWNRQLSAVLNGKPLATAGRFRM